MLYCIVCIFYFINKQFYVILYIWNDPIKIQNIILSWPLMLTKTGIACKDNINKIKLHKIISKTCIKIQK